MNNTYSMEMEILKTGDKKEAIYIVLFRFQSDTEWLGRWQRRFTGVFDGGLQGSQMTWVQTLR